MMIVPHLTLPLSHWSSEDLLSGVTSMTLHCYCTEESMTALSNFDTGYKYTVCQTGLWVIYSTVGCLDEVKVNRMVFAFP